jgi:phosphoribulokinase
MPDKLMRLWRHDQPEPRRPVMLAIAGDSAAGKTTLTRGIAETLGPDRATALCVDDYHRYDRAERRDVPFTVLHPDCNYIEVMEQHLQLLALGRPILKPVYDHSTGELVRPVLVEPRDFVIVEGLLPLHTKLARACFDITVYLDPPEEIRRKWKIRRDCAERGYTPEAVLAELDRREPDSAAFIRPQRQWADIALRFAPVAGQAGQPGGTVSNDALPGGDGLLNGAPPGSDGSLSAEILLRPTIGHPDLSHVLTDDDRRTVHLKLIRDTGGRPVDALHVHGHAPREDSRIVEKAIWAQLSFDHGTVLPDLLGQYAPGKRNEALAIAQLLLLWHLLEARG